MENPDAPEIYRPLAGSQIRLIYIQPGQPDELIRCEFKHVSLGQNVEYCALSYVWGDPNHTKNIELDGKLFPVTTNLHNALHRFRCIQMEECSWRENSVAMRRHERRGNRPYGFWHWDEGVLDQRKSESYERTFEARFSNSLSQKPLWVDAICISQHNVDERNREVSRMRDIYNSAFCTVAWLGNAASPRQKQYIDTIVDAADELMNFLMVIGRPRYI